MFIVIFSTFVSYVVTTKSNGERLVGNSKLICQRRVWRYQRGNQDP